MPATPRGALPPATSRREARPPGRGKGERAGVQSGGRSKRNGAAEPSPGAKKGRRRSKSTTGAIVELVVIIVVALGLALGIQAFIVKPYRIPSGSMEPTLSIGQRVLVNRIGMDFSEPHVGEIAVFHPARRRRAGGVRTRAARDHARGRRVLDAGAQGIERELHQAHRRRARATKSTSRKVTSTDRPAHTSQFVRENDSYIRQCGVSPECNFPTPIKIPAGHWFMMGDNRGESDDSRFWGPVPTGWIIGRPSPPTGPPTASASSSDGDALAERVVSPARASAAGSSARARRRARRASSGQRLFAFDRRLGFRARRRRRRGRARLPRRAARRRGRAVRLRRAEHPRAARARRR